MTQIVHVQTTIQTVFGILDDDGNVIPQQPVVAQAAVFSAETFADAFEKIKTARDQAESTMPPDAELEGLG